MAALPRLLPAALLLLAASGCASAPPAHDERPVALGELTRERIEETVPDWVAAQADAEVDAAAAAALAGVAPGAEVIVFLGTWCGDSKRELSRLWRALDLAALDAPPFTLRYVGVDRAKKRPRELLGGQGVRYVPTFVVRRAGAEVGRIVESAPAGIESDLLALLRGERSGVLSRRDDVGAARSGDP